MNREEVYFAPTNSVRSLVTSGHSAVSILQLQYVSEANMKFQQSELA